MQLALPAGGAERSVDPLHSLFFVWRRWKFIFATTAVALLVASAWLNTATPRYVVSGAIPQAALPANTAS
jgi:uncharacterized protein involved in exopolysaccharide biosynthesis